MGSETGPTTSLFAGGLSTDPVLSLTFTLSHRINPTDFSPVQLFVMTVTRIFRSVPERLSSTGSTAL